MNLRLCIVSATPTLLREAIAAAKRHAVDPFDVCVFANGALDWDWPSLKELCGGRLLFAEVTANQGVTAGLHKIWEMAAADNRVAYTADGKLVEPAWNAPIPGDKDILLYIHDDVEIREHGWDLRVRVRFQASSNCGLVTFGGAKRLGSGDLYTLPYAMDQLARGTFLSNMGSAHVHGVRTTLDQRIATPDGFSIGLRRDLLDKLGGWSWYPYPHHNYDNAIACQARRHGYESWLVPVACEHFGGRTATVAVYQEFAQREWGGDPKIHADSHVWLYNEFRDVLPVIV